MIGHYKINIPEIFKCLLFSEFDSNCNSKLIIVIMIVITIIIVFFE